MSHDSNSVNSYRVPKIPPFWSNDPETWFISVEASFQVARITDDVTKFHTVLANADIAVLSHIKDLIRNPPSEGKYDALKQRLLGAFETSQDARLRQLLKGQVLGDKKPSHFLQELKNLAGDQCSNNILKTLFVEQLPESYRGILATIEEPDLNKFAAIADKIADSMTLSRSVASMSNSTHEFGNSDSFHSRGGEPFDEKTINLLATKVANKLKFGKSRSRSQSGNRFKRSSPKHDKPRNFNTRCYYHQRFGVKARKCQQPCSWVTKSEKENL